MSDQLTHAEYVIRLFKDGNEIRTSHAVSRTAAESLIDAFIDHTQIKDRVIWDSDTVNRTGKLHGTSRDGVSFDITVEPPLHVALGEPVAK